MCSVRQWETTVNNKIIAVFVSILVAGCASHPAEKKETERDGGSGAVEVSYLVAMKSEIDPAVNLLLEAGNRDEVAELEQESELTKPGALIMLKSLPQADEQGGFSVSKDTVFSADAEVMVAADGMPLADFVHYIFGEILGTSYVLDPALSGQVDDGSGVTLKIIDKLSKQKLFELTKRVLADRNIAISSVDGVYFIKPSTTISGGSLVVGVGNRFSDIPLTDGKILQLVPLDFGIKIFIPQLLTDLVTAKITPNYQTNVIMIEGDRAQVVRAMELIDIFDIPSAKGRYVGTFPLTYMDPSSAGNMVVDLLKNEGVDAGLNSAKDNVSVSLLPLKGLSSVVVFGTTEAQVNRTAYWLGIVDQPSDTTEAGGDGAVGGKKGYAFFTYKAIYGRAQDVWDGVSGLVGGGASMNAKGADFVETTDSAPNAERLSGGGIQAAVNSRSNTVTFLTTGTQYQTILPLLRRFDVPPRQIMLDLMIAEVTLKDEFKHGVEWAVQRGEVSLTTQGAFGASSFGGMGLTITGSEGPLKANFIGTNNLVKVLSNPTLMVLDGEDASFTVGSSISVIGATTQDPIGGERQTTASTYRDTGLSVTVTPEILSGSLVKMLVSESISNSVPGSAGASSNPDIFTRSLDTTVIASSGQTILLAGLISESNSGGSSGTPGLSKIPLLGNLFKAKSSSTDRSELVMLITPKVLTSTTEWDRVKAEFEAKLKVLGSQEP